VEAGQWDALAAETDAEASFKGQRAARRDPAEEQAARLEGAVRKVRENQLSRARRDLCAPALAPGTPATLSALKDPQKRPSEPSEPLEDHELHFQPPAPLRLDPQGFADALRSAPRGSSGALSGMRYEHLKLALDDEATLADLWYIAQRAARAEMPEVIQQAFRMGAMTSLSKPDGGIRGIVAGEALRRLISRALATQFSEVFRESCLPFQFGLSTKAGTDCVGHALRSLTGADPHSTVLAVDGVGAYDHAKRKGMLRGLSELPGANALMPYVRMFYSTPGECLWTDAERVLRIRSPRGRAWSKGTL